MCHFDIYRFNYIHWITRSYVRYYRKHAFIYYYETFDYTFINLNCILGSYFKYTNNMSNRIDDLYQLQSLEIDKIKYRSIRESIIIYQGLSCCKIIISMVLGRKVCLIESLIIRDNITTVRAQDHLHNDFLDISVKYGLPSLLLLILMYYTFPLSKNKEISLSMLTLLIISIFPEPFCS